MVKLFGIINLVSKTYVILFVTMLLGLSSKANELNANMASAERYFEEANIKMSQGKIKESISLLKKNSKTCSK